MWWAGGGWGGRGSWQGAAGGVSGCGMGWSGLRRCCRAAGGRLQQPRRPEPPPPTPPQCYKVVSALFERQLRKAPASGERVNVLYAVHKVLGASKKALRGKSRYRERRFGGVAACALLG
jgi:hypothetical protein